MSVRVTLSGPAGDLEALLDEPAAGADTTTARAAVVFAHPHPLQGGTMHTKAVFQGAKGLRRIGCAVLRFNFRGVGASTGSFDAGAGEREDFRAALDFMRDRHPDTALWAAGFSFGAWIALEAGATDPRVDLLIAVAPPVCRADYTFDASLESTKPKFLVHGGLDEVCSVKDLWAFYGKLKEPKEIVVIDGASHLFEGRTGEVGEALEDLLGDFD
jgi:alpha/beta superfamily hydrolase